MRHASLATRYLDDAVARLIEANQDQEIPRGLVARAGHRRWLYAATGGAAHLKGADQDLKDAEEIARRDEPNGGAMRLFLADIALERCRLNLAQIARARGSDPAGRTPSAARGRSIVDWLLGRKPQPTPAATRPVREQDQQGAKGSDPQGLTPSLLRLAEAHWKQTADLVKETGYHRRDPELAELRRELDGRHSAER